MKIIDQVNKFYRVVASDPEEGALEYQHALKVTMSMPNVARIIEFLRDWSTSPFFRIEDIKDQLLALMNMISSRYKGRVDTWFNAVYTVENSQYIGQELQAKIVNIIAENFIKTSEDFFGRDYIAMERDTLLTPETLKMAQHRVLLEVMKELQKKDDNWINALELFQNLILSHRISQNLIKGLAKRFGPEFYGALYANARAGGPGKHSEVKQFWKKKKPISIWDVSEFLGLYLEQPIQSSELKKMIAKSDNEAKQYWQRLLYAGPHYYGTRISFILDEEMNPMDMDYNKIEWPQEVRILKLNNIVTNDREDLENFVNTWRRIFEEFHIIPL